MECYTIEEKLLKLVRMFMYTTHSCSVADGKEGTLRKMAGGGDLQWPEDGDEEIGWRRGHI